MWHYISLLLQIHMPLYITAPGNTCTIIFHRSWKYMYHYISSLLEIHVPLYFIAPGNTCTIIFHCSWKYMYHYILSLLEIHVSLWISALGEFLFVTVLWLYDHCLIILKLTSVLTNTSGPTQYMFLKSKVFYKSITVSFLYQSFKTKQLYTVLNFCGI